MSSDDRRIGALDLERFETVRHVADLTLWEHDPFGGHDVGIEILAQDRLGQTERVLVHGDVVLWGGVIVTAERMEPLNGGMVAVVDVSRQWTVDEAKVEVLRRFKRAKDAFPDATLLGELMADLAAKDLALLNSVGFDGDDIDAMTEALKNMEGGDGLFGPPGDGAFKYSVSVVCVSESEQIRAIELLRAEGFDARPVTVVD